MTDEEQRSNPCGIYRWVKNQFDAEPVACAIANRANELGLDVDGKVALLGICQEELERVRYAPPRPDASAGLIEAAEWHEEQVKKYKKHGGFSMRELELFHNEAAAALRARASDRSGK